MHHYVGFWQIGSHMAFTHIVSPLTWTMFTKMYTDIHVNTHVDVYVHKQIHAHQTLQAKQFQ